MTTSDTDEREERKEKDPRKPLTQREVFELFLNDVALRPYVFAALGALAMIFLVMFMSGSDIGGVIVVLFGLATMTFRWIAGPPCWLFILFYFQVFPFGIPEFDGGSPLVIRESYFRVADVLLVASILVYLRSVYRIFGIIHQSMPFEQVYNRKGDHPVRRPTSHIQPGEIVWLIGVAVGLVILGQFIWWLVNAIEFSPNDEEFPLRWADTRSLARYRRTPREVGEFTPGENRFFIILGVLFFGLLFVRLIFGYWRLRMMSAAQGAMVLTDTSWSESHRERVRVEKWRIWGCEKAKEDEKKRVRAERERQAKEAAARERAEARERRAKEEQRERAEARERRRR